MGPVEPVLNQTVALWGCSGHRLAWASCFSCTLTHAHEHSVVLTLSGICDKSAFDKYYHLENDELGYLILYGFTGTIIRYDEVSRVWNISVIHKPDVSATSTAFFEILILGNHEWEITNDKLGLNWAKLSSS